jgi:type VI secretion system protein ImpK
VSNVRIASLASLFQEVLTAIVRVRFRLQTVADADVFRGQIRQSLQLHMQQARALGYASETVQHAVFAVVALLDESVLNLQDPVFVQWARRPLQEELFGGHLAGETFFRNLRDALHQPDSVQLADVLELHCLCLLLGYRGRYALVDSGELHAQLRQARERIQRIRGDASMLPYAALAAAGTTVNATSRWNLYLLWSVCTLASLVLIALIVYPLSLASGAAALGSSALNGF